MIGATCTAGNAPSVGKLKLISAITQRQSSFRKSVLLLVAQQQRLHFFGGGLDQLEVLQNLEGTVNHLILDSAFVRDADVVGDVADHQPVAADEAEHSRQHLVRAGTCRGC